MTCAVAIPRGRDRLLLPLALRNDLLSAKIICVVGECPEFFFLARKLRSGEKSKLEDFVDLRKRLEAFPMTIESLRFVSMRPRTNL